MKYQKKSSKTLKKLSDGIFFLSCGYKIGRHFWTVMVTSLSQLLIGKCLLLNLLVNLLFQTSKSYKSSTDFEEPPIFFLSFFLDNHSQVASIYIHFIHICYIPFSIFGCLSQKHPVNDLCPSSYDYALPFHPTIYTPMLYF